MTKPYSIFKCHTGIYYVQFRLEDGSRSTSKSTGCRIRAEAERKAMEWVVNGNIPTRINGKEESESFSSVEKIKFLNDLRTFDFTNEEVKSIVKILKDRNYITSDEKSCNDLLDSYVRRTFGGQHYQKRCSNNFR